MIAKRIWRMAWLALFLAVLVLPLQAAQADVGPKPTMKFEFTFDDAPVAIVEATLLECEDAACTVSKPLMVAGPQRLTCISIEDCHALAYGFKAYHKLVIRFSDKTRESNIFQKKGYEALYTVRVRADRLEVSEQVNFNLLNCCIGLAGTLAVEWLAALAVLSVFNLPHLLLGWVPFASLLTLPAVWFGFPQLPLPPVAMTGLSEVFAVVAEAGLFYVVTGRTIGWRRALLLSAAINTASFVVGLLV